MSIPFTSDVVEFGDGSAAAPGLRLAGSPTTGAFEAAVNVWGITTAGAQRFQVGSFGTRVATAGSAGAPAMSRIADSNTGGFFPVDDAFGIAGGGREGLRVDDDATAGNTALSVFDVDNSTLERVTVGIADSGGVGFKLLRIPN